MESSQTQGGVPKFPKKMKKKNGSGFFMFVNYRRKQVSEHGKRFSGNEEAVKFFDHEWQQMPAEEKKGWKKKADDISDGVFSSSTFSAAALNLPEVSNELVAPGSRASAQEALVRRMAVDEDRQMDCKLFAMIHFNIYSRTTEGVMPAEFSVCTFSLKEGITKCESSLLYPKIKGYSTTYLVRQAVEKFGLPRPCNQSQSGDLGDVDDDDDRFEKVLEKIQCAGKKWDKNENASTPVVLFARRDDIVTIEECIKWLNKKCDKNVEAKIFPVSMLMTTLSLLGKERDKTAYAIASENQAEQYYLSDTTFDLETVLGCEWHQQEKFELYGKVAYCSMNIVKRNIYMVLIAVSKSYNMELEEAIHFPDLHNKKPKKATVGPIHGVLSRDKAF